jgi:hypothetical protein
MVLTTPVPLDDAKPLFSSLIVRAAFARTSDAWVGAHEASLVGGPMLQRGYDHPQKGVGLEGVQSPMVNCEGEVAH